MSTTTDGSRTGIPEECTRFLVTTERWSTRESQWVWCGDDAEVGGDDVPLAHDDCVAQAQEAWATYIQQWELEEWAEGMPGSEAYRLDWSCAEHEQCSECYGVEFAIVRNPETGEPIGIEVCA